MVSRSRSSHRQWSETFKKRIVAEANVSELVVMGNFTGQDQFQHRPALPDRQFNDCIAFWSCAFAIVEPQCV
jgi:hypothetical protein